MPVSINMPSRQQQADPLEKLATALSIAKTVYGISNDSKALEAKLAEQKAQAERMGKQDELTGLQIDQAKREAQGIITPKERASMMKDLMPAKEGEKGAFMLQTIGPGGSPTQEWVKKAAKEKDPVAEQLAQARLDQLQMKKDELSSTQGKQRGLLEIGQKAEQQYREAISNPSDYDPTSSGQIIDNSSWAPNFLKNNNAIKAKAAQNSWVEAFLRDASGAAIAPSEREAYARDFFPQPGDPAEVVANKQALREQKMENARIASGARSGPTQADQPQSAKSMGMAAGPGAAPKPKTVMQNGHVYTLNPKTGEYE